MNLPLEEEGPPAMSVMFCEDESDIRPIVRTERVTVSNWRGQPTCTLCRTLQNTTMFREDGTFLESGMTVYKNFAEMEEIAKDGCSTCRIFRAAILYKHPAREASKLLHMDDDRITVSPVEKMA